VVGARDHRRGEGCQLGKEVELEALGHFFKREVEG